MKRITNPLLIAVTILVCLVIMELALRCFAPVPDPYGDYKITNLNRFIKLDRIPNERLQTQPEEGMRGVWGVNLLTRNQFGFRGGYLARPKPKGEFRIFMVDASSLECLFLDDSQSVDAVLQNELNKHITGNAIVKVYNASASGAKLDDNISMLVHRVMHLEPDMIILLAGVNDLIASMNKYDYLHYPTVKKRIPFSLLTGMLATEFQIPRRTYYLIKGIASGNKTQILEMRPVRLNFQQTLNLNLSSPATERKPRVDLVAYRNNLKTAIGLAKVADIRLVLLTQATTWDSRIDPEAKKFQWMRRHSGLIYREDLMEQALGLFNDAMRQLSREYSVPLYDLARIMPKSMEYFIDDCHFNIKGAKAVGIGLAVFIREKNLIPRLSREGLIHSATNPDACHRERKAVSPKGLKTVGLPLSVSTLSISRINLENKP